jgi:hypothetical protein
MSQRSEAHFRFLLTVADMLSGSFPQMMSSPQFRELIALAQLESDSMVRRAGWLSSPERSSQRNCTAARGSPGYWCEQFRIHRGQPGSDLRPGRESKLVKDMLHVLGRRRSRKH